MRDGEPGGGGFEKDGTKRPSQPGDAEKVPTIPGQCQWPTSVTGHFPNSPGTAVRVDPVGCGKEVLVKFRPDTAKFITARVIFPVIGAISVGAPCRRCRCGNASRGTGSIA